MIVAVCCHLLLAISQTNDALVAPLLRLKDNSCHVEEAEKILRQHSKFAELVILYEKKEMHKKGWLQSRTSFSSDQSFNKQLTLP